MERIQCQGYIGPFIQNNEIVNVMIFAFFDKRRKHCRKNDDPLTWWMGDFSPVMLVNYK
jgi:hypothetical protein